MVRRFCALLALGLIVPAPLSACEAGGKSFGLLSTIAAPDLAHLADGTVIRLDGVVLPHGPDLAELQGAMLQFGDERKTDRRGRPVGQVFLSGAPGEDPVWLQGLLVSRGIALASGRGASPCTERLIVRERAADDAGTGIWARRGQVVFEAREPAALLTRAGLFTIVEGRVESVGERRLRTYLNFGSYWMHDFTVTVSGHDRDKFAAKGLDLAALAGQTIRVRGWIRDDRGPAIEATFPEQIEIVDSR